LFSRSDGATATKGESHENEGFLKSLWHNITNHPTHPKKPEDGGKTKDDKPKSEDEPKKNSGSGSGPGSGSGSG
jgi:molecular chaperone DnaJ